MASLAKARSHSTQTRRAEEVCDGSQAQLIFQIIRQVHSDEADLTSSQEVKSQRQDQDQDPVQWSPGKPIVKRQVQGCLTLTLNPQVKVQTTKIHGHAQSQLIQLKCSSWVKGRGPPLLTAFSQQSGLSYKVALYQSWFWAWAAKAVEVYVMGVHWLMTVWSPGWIQNSEWKISTREVIWCWPGNAKLMTKFFLSPKLVESRF